VGFYQFIRGKNCFDFENWIIVHICSSSVDPVSHVIKSFDKIVIKHATK